MAKRGRKRKRFFTIQRTRKSQKVSKHLENEVHENEEDDGDTGNPECEEELSKEDNSRKLVLQQPNSANNFKIEVLNKNSGITINSRGRNTILPSSSGKKILYVTPKRLLESESGNEFIINKRNVSDIHVQPNVQIVSAISKSNIDYESSKFSDLSQNGNTDTVVINVSQPPINKINGTPSLIIQNDAQCMFPGTNPNNINSTSAQFPEEREVQLHIEEDDAINFSEHLSILDEMEADNASPSCHIPVSNIVTNKQSTRFLANPNSIPVVANTFCPSNSNAQKFFKIIPDPQKTVTGMVSSAQHISPILTSTTHTSPSIISLNNNSATILNKYSVASFQKSTNVIMTSPTTSRTAGIQTISIGRGISAGPISIPNLVIKSGAEVKFIAPSSSAIGTMPSTLSCPVKTSNSLMKSPQSSTVENKCSDILSPIAQKIITKIIPAVGNISPMSVVPNSMSSTIKPQSNVETSVTTLCVPIVSSSSIEKYTTENKTFKASMISSEPLKINLKSVQVSELGKSKLEEPLKVFSERQSINICSPNSVAAPNNISESNSFVEIESGSLEQPKGATFDNKIKEESHRFPFDESSNLEDGCASEDQEFEVSDIYESKESTSELRELKMKIDDKRDKNSDLDLRALQRRRRIAFTPRQYKLLQTTFEHNNFPEPIEQRSIAQQLGAPYRSIKMWFQNKRAAVRKRLGPDEAPRTNGSPRTKYKNVSDTSCCFYCDVCPSAFIAHAFLKRHREYHQKKTYQCESCKLSFTHPDLLVTHGKARCKKSSITSNLLSDDKNEEASNLTSEKVPISPVYSKSIDNELGPNNPITNTSELERTSLPTVLKVPKPQLAINLLSFHDRSHLSSSEELNSTITSTTKLADTKASSITDKNYDAAKNHFSPSDSNNSTDISDQPINLKKITENSPVKYGTNNQLLNSLTKGKHTNDPYFVVENEKQKDNNYKIKEETLFEVKCEVTPNNNDQVDKVNNANSLLHQLFLNQFKQQQRDQQAHVIQKLSEYYLQQLQMIQRQTPLEEDQLNQQKVKNETFDDVDSNADERSVEIEESNGLQYGNLTIYPVKTKSTYEHSMNQPIDLSSRKGNTTDISDDENSVVSDRTTPNRDTVSFNYNKLKEESKIMNLGSAAMLPLLLLAQNEWATKNPSNEQEITDKTQSNDSFSKEDIYPHVKDQGQLLNAVFANILKVNGSEDDGSEVTEVDGAPELDTLEDQASPKNQQQNRSQRRRTTVFSESQHRILYQHFTHCNFPEPAMFRILASLIGLEAAVIKIWFQNERSRQRKRANFMLQGNNAFSDKPYKCADCDMSFAMATFLVKHSARHSQQDQSQSMTKVCPICTLKFDNDAYIAHLKSVHQVDMVFEKGLDDKDDVEALTCYLCKTSFEDQEALFLHKREHLSKNFGNVSTCSFCDSSFVNAICLEAHMQTHFKLEWKYECESCKAKFPEEVLLKSHAMSHGTPAPTISAVNRYRSQTFDGGKKVSQLNSSNKQSILEAQLRQGSEKTTSVRRSSSATDLKLYELRENYTQLKKDNIGQKENEDDTKDIFSKISKCKKKLPDLIPISECAYFKRSGDEKDKLTDIINNFNCSAVSNLARNSALYSLVSENLARKKIPELVQMPANPSLVSEGILKNLDHESKAETKYDSDDATMSDNDDGLIIDENPDHDTENDMDTEKDIVAEESVRSCADIVKSMNLDILTDNPLTKEKFLLALQNSLTRNNEENIHMNNSDQVEKSEASCSTKMEENFEFKRFRNRREYTQEEQLILLTHFQHNHFPPSKELKLLACRLNITQRQIMHWFQNRRSKERKALPYARRVSKQCPNCKSSFVHDEALENHKVLAHNQDKIAVQYWCPVKTCLMNFPNVLLLQTHEFEHRISLITDTSEEEPDIGNLTASKQIKNVTRMIPNAPDSPTDPTALTTLINLTPPLSNMSPPLETQIPPQQSKVSSTSETQIKTPSALLSTDHMPVHVHQLELHFQENNYPSPQELNALCTQFKLGNKNLNIWFENKRNRILTNLSADSGKGDSEFNCPMCSAAFVTKGFLQQHIALHSHGNALTCAVCSAVFRHHSVYESHVQMHSPSKPPTDSMSTVALLSPTHSVDYSSPSKSNQTAENDLWIDTHEKTSPDRMKKLVRRGKDALVDESTDQTGEDINIETDNTHFQTKITNISTNKITTSENYLLPEVKDWTVPVNKKASRTHGRNMEEGTSITKI